MATKKRSRERVDLARALAETRDEKRLSKTKACIELGVSRMTYDMWERDSWVPHVERYKEIARFIDADPRLILNELMIRNGVAPSDLPDE